MTSGAYAQYGGLGSLLEGTTPKDIEALFKAEPPLNSKDIDFYIASLPLFLLEENEAQLISLASQYNLSQERVGYDLIKIGIGLMLIEEMFTRSEIISDMGTDAIIPSDSEMALIKNNIPRINTAINALLN
jgi:hypothetical protein